MSARKKNPEPETPEEPLNFEQAIADLDAIVSSMEERQLPLEDLVASYEKGIRLLGRCESLLQSARKRLQTIGERDASGKSSGMTDSLDEEGDMSDDAPATPDAPDDDDDDIRLF